MIGLIYVLPVDEVIQTGRKKTRNNEPLLKQIASATGPQGGMFKT